MDEQKIQEVIDALNEKLEAIENGLPEEIQPKTSNTLENNVSTLVESLPVGSLPDKETTAVISIDPTP